MALRDAPPKQLEQLHSCGRETAAAGVGREAKDFVGVPTGGPINITGEVAVRTREDRQWQ